MLEKLQPKNFDAVYAIMEEAFPYDEYRSYEEQKALLLNPDYNIYIVSDQQSKEIKSFITIWRFENFAFIEHFATRTKYRNSGLGSLILNELSNLLKCRICFEVELPDTESAKRRIEFYKRNGFYENPFKYIQPPISKGKKTIELKIMSSNGLLSKDEFEIIKNTLYKNVYKTNGNDSIIK